MENSTTERIIEQIGLCPSGALSYVRSDEKPVEITIT